MDYSNMTDEQKKTAKLSLTRQLMQLQEQQVQVELLVAQAPANLSALGIQIDDVQSQLEPLSDIDIGPVVVQRGPGSRPGAGS